MKKYFWLILSVLVTLALVLRLYHFDGRAPFDWDQDRDYSEVQRIARGVYVPLGPVAKGEGGFHLGSLYYYLLYPGYTLLHEDLSALPVTSVIIDVLVVGCLYVLLTKLMGSRGGVVALIWAVSWFLIEAARVSWNVALVPLWSLLTLYSLTRVLEGSRRHFFVLALLAGLAVHVHVACIPLIPLLLIVFFRRYSFSFSDWVLAVLCGLVPVLPLMLYDLTHSFANYHLLRQQMAYQNSFQTPLLPMLAMTMTKLGKVVSGLLFSQFRDNILLGIATMLLALHGIYTKSLVLKIAGWMICLSTLCILLLHDYGFPEYYFAPSYVAILILITATMRRMFGKLGLGLFLGILVLVNICAYTTTPTGYSLQVKKEIVHSLSEYREPIDLTYQCDPGREGGFRVLVAQSRIILDPKAKTRILVTDKLHTPLYIDGELARDLVQIGNIKTALYIVQ